MTATLQTRTPTGKVAYPTIIVEGPSKSGRSFLCYRLSADERVGDSFVFELGENRADEYASLGPYQIVDHDGTFSGLYGQVEAATRVPRREADKPNVIILDTGSALWDMLKDWASSRARNSAKNQKMLREDPDAEIDVSSNYWNDAKSRWWKVINLLKAWEGIAIIVARAEDKTKFEGGQPTKATEWTRELEKGTVYAATAVIRTGYPAAPMVTDVNSLHVELDDRGFLTLPEDGGLGHLVFDILGAAGGFVPERLNLVDGTALAKTPAKTALLTRVEQVIFETPDVTLDNETASKIARAAWIEVEEAQGWREELKQEWSHDTIEEIVEVARRMVGEWAAGSEAAAGDDDATAAA